MPQHLIGTQIVVVAHQPVASAMLALVQHVFGAVPEGVHAVNVIANQTPEQVAQSIQTIVGAQPTLLLTDLPGATPHNGAAACLTTRVDWRLISPLTAPLLLRAINYKHQRPDALFTTLVPTS